MKKSYLTRKYFLANDVNSLENINPIDDSVYHLRKTNVYYSDYVAGGEHNFLLS